MKTKKPVFSLAEPTGVKHRKEPLPQTAEKVEEDTTSALDLKNDDPSLPIVNMGTYNGVAYPAKLV